MVRICFLFNKTLQIIFLLATITCNLYFNYLAAASALRRWVWSAKLYSRVVRQQEKRRVERDFSGFGQQTLLENFVVGHWQTSYSQEFINFLSTVTFYSFYFQYEKRRPTLWLKISNQLLSRWFNKYIHFNLEFQYQLLKHVDVMLRANLWLSEFFEYLRNVHRKLRRSVEFNREGAKQKTLSDAW